MKVKKDGGKKEKEETKEKLGRKEKKKELSRLQFLAYL